MIRLAMVLISLVLSVSVVSAKEITLVAGLSLPPYIIQETNNGMEYDIVKEALAKNGHTLKLKSVPFIRVSFEYKKFDGAITINEASGVKGNYSDVTMVYQNFAISLKDKAVPISTIQDLGDKNIVAFQNATKYLGEEYKKIVESNPNYKEQGKQEVQVKLLYSGRADAIVSDINIFKYYRKAVTGVDTSAEVVYHNIFPETEYKVLFNDPAIRDEFNQALADLRSSGRYQEIINNYIK